MNFHPRPQRDQFHGRSSFFRRQKQSHAFGPRAGGAAAGGGAVNGGAEPSGTWVDIPPYQVDVLVRGSEALAKTKDGRMARDVI